MAVTVVGVRHHSPACAGWVRRTLARVRPARVLVEGPSEFNPRIHELLLDHEPPVALLTTALVGDLRLASWAPFCAHSPEWIALREAGEADRYFMDLPAWASDRGENRYADAHRQVDPMLALAEAVGEEGFDAAWDACFELPDATDLPDRLAVTFRAMREADPPGSVDVAREAHMAAWVRWAAGQPGDTVVVCGGFHAPFLEEAAAADPLPGPPPPPEAPAELRAATWMVPYDERRLDAFTGYAAGMPSPAWCRWVWTEGIDRAATQALEATARRLRAQGALVSVADVGVAWTLAQGLARLRGHRAVARVDLLDAVASAWIKEGLEQRLPWASRRPLDARTHPVLVELVAALTGERTGRLDPRTPAPPLVASLRADCAAVGLDLHPSSPRDLDCTHAPHLRVVLERLQLLGLAAVTRHDRNRWLVRQVPTTEVEVLEAAGYGPTLELAALAILEERAARADGLRALVLVVQDAARAELPSLSERALGRLLEAVTAEQDLARLGEGLGALVGLLRHGELAPGHLAAVAALIEPSLDRLLWLMEGLQGQGPAAPDRVAAVAAAVDAASLPGTSQRSRCGSVLHRVASNRHAPADLRGAALGGLVRLEALDDHELHPLALTHILAAGPDRLGDYLFGLLRLARGILDRPLLQAVDQVLDGLSADDFLVALPALRLAFHALPTRERAEVGRAVATLHGFGMSALHAPLRIDAEQVARAHALEAEADRWHALVDEG